MFGTVLTVAVTVLQLYVFWRAVPLARSRAMRRMLALGGLALWAVFVFGRLRHDAMTRVGMITDAIGMVWMSVLFLTATCLLAIDVVTLCGALFRPVVRRLRVAALACGAGLSVLAFVQAHRAPVVERYEIGVAGLPRELDGTTVVAVSDLHLNSVEESAWLRARVRQVMAERPDLVVLLGDTVEGHGAPDGAFARILGTLRVPLGVWAVLGNHESYGRAREANAALLADAGVHVLRDAWVQLRPGLILAGVNDTSFADRRTRVPAEITQALQGAPAAPTILLSHAPVGAEVAAARGVSLMLSGHTHGGQIWPFSYVVAHRYPRLDGRYVVNGMTLLVCRGTGTWGPGMRLWRRSAILRITLHAARVQGSTFQVQS